MLENLLKLKGVKKLSPTEMTKIQCGETYHVYCFSKDGSEHYWTGSTNIESVYEQMVTHCKSGGGSGFVIEH